MSATATTGVVANGVIVPNAPLPEGAKVEVVVVPQNTANTRSAPLPRGVPACQVLGIAAGDAPPPDDETVARWIQESRMDKFG